jgi:hypothetical protein
MFKELKTVTLASQLPFILLFGMMLFEYGSVENLQNHFSFIVKLFQ